MQMRAFTASSTVSRPCTRLGDGRSHRQRRAGQLQRRTVTTQANILEDAINTLTTFINKSPLNEGKKQLAVRQAGDYDAVATRGAINSLINEHPVVVFSWTKCPFCVNAKQLLDDLDAKYTAMELDIRDDGKAFRAELGQVTNRTSMPNVFIGGTSYGGCNDGPGIATLHKEGRLVPLLKSVGAL
jgi:glutaredoxin 3